MCTGTARDSGELRLPLGHRRKVEDADPALRKAFESANKQLDSLRHGAGSSSSRYRQLLAERASVYAKIDQMFAVPCALQALALTLTGKIDKFSASIGNLAASLSRELSTAVDAATEALGGTDAENACARRM